MRAPVEARRESGRLDPSIWKIGSVAVLGSFLAQLDATIVNVSLSSLAETLQSSLAAIQWVTSGYLLALLIAATVRLPRSVMEAAAVKTSNPTKSGGF
jgi:MFS family permease